MRLNVTSESDTFVYATSPISFGGLAKEDLLFWMIPMAFTKDVIVDDPLIAFCVGLFCLWFYKKVTAGQPEGYLILSASVKAAQWPKSVIAQRLPPVKIVFSTLNKLITTVWLAAGSIPSPQHCNRYEP
jgi:hypothetical protein